MKCPKCGGEMEEGIAIDPTYFGASLWTNKITGILGTDTKTQKIKSFRCTKCGYLESYAK